MAVWSGCILITDDSLILQANQTVVRWLEYSAVELNGISIHALLGAGGQFFWQSQILPMLKLKGILEEVYLRMKLKSGASIPFLANIGYVLIDGTARIEISLFRIAQRGRLEDELLQAKKLAEQANDAKTKFLGMMSHELRTPLQLISLNNQLLLEEALGGLTPDQGETVKSSQDALDSVVVLIDDILNYARMQGGPVQVSIEDVAVEHALKRAETSTCESNEAGNSQLQFATAVAVVYGKIECHRQSSVERTADSPCSLHRPSERGSRTPSQASSGARAIKSSFVKTSAPSDGLLQRASRKA